MKPLQGGRSRWNEAAIISFDYRLGPTSTPQVVGLDPVSLKGWEHRVEKWNGKIKQLVCRHGIKLMRVRQIFEIDNVAAAVILRPLKVRMLYDADVGKCRIVDVEPIGVGQRMPELEYQADVGEITIVANWPDNPRAPSSRSYPR